MEKTQIPENIIQMCRDFGKVAIQHGLCELSGKFTPRHTDWGGDVSFSWKAGRHGEDSDEISITSQFFVHTKVNQPTQQ